MVLICRDGTRPNKPGIVGKPFIDPCHDGSSPHAASQRSMVKQAFWWKQPAAQRSGRRNSRCSSRSGLERSSGSLRAETVIIVSHSSVAAKLHQSCAKVAFCGERGASRTEPCSSPGDHPQSRAPMSRIGQRSPAARKGNGNTIPQICQQSHAQLGSGWGSGVRWTTPDAFLQVGNLQWWKS